jgi:hypothetical protein
MRGTRLIIVSICCFLLWTVSCRKDFVYVQSTGNLEFSKDTVFLDTVFTNIGSSTYSLKVYNRSKEDIEIPSIRLGEGNNSQYRLNVDGVSGTDFTNVPLFAKDSLYVFIETTFDIAPANVKEFLYVDELLFDTGANQQEVPLVTLVKDAVFLYPSTLSDGSKESISFGEDEEGNQLQIEGFVLEDDELTFTNEKPYVVYGYAAVAAGKTLQMNAGTRVHFHKNSGILVGSGGSIKVNGALSSDPMLLENEVIFEGDRLEPEFSEVPGQWGTIWLSPGSIENDFSYLTIKNATVGLLVEGNPTTTIPTLSIKNSQLYNSTTINLWARNTSIEGENLVLGNAGISSLYCNLGGSYIFLHSTFANYWSNGFRTGPTLLVDNFETDGLQVTASQDLVRADFINCIIDGNTRIELQLNGNETTAFNYFFSHSLIKFRDDDGLFTNDPIYDFQNTALFNTVILNAAADFGSTSNNDYRIGPNSEVIGLGEPNTALLVPLDLLGRDRTVNPAIGAYQEDP